MLNITDLNGKKQKTYHHENPSYLLLIKCSVVKVMPAKQISFETIIYNNDNVLVKTKIMIVSNCTVIW